MSWYDKYLAIYNHDYHEVSADVICEINHKLKGKNVEQPFVSAVVIAHNEEKRILACLWSLADNECKYPIEICVVNDHSDDHTQDVLYAVGVRNFYEEKKSPGFARQCGLDNARGKYHLCIDADTIYPKYYIETMIEHLQRQGVVAVYGLWSFLPDNELSPFRLKLFELLRDCYLNLQNFNRPELNVRGMVFGFKIEVARKYGFRTDIIRGEDGSLALNMKNDGKIVFVRSRKARPITDNSIIKNQGSLIGALWLRARKAINNIHCLFCKKNHYEDNEDNLIK